MRCTIAHNKEILMVSNATIRPGALIIEDTHMHLGTSNPYNVSRVAALLRGWNIQPSGCFLARATAVLIFGKQVLAAWSFLLPDQLFFLWLGFLTPLYLRRHGRGAGVIREGTTPWYSLINMRTFPPNNSECIIPDA